MFLSSLFDGITRNGFSLALAASVLAAAGCAGSGKSQKPDGRPEVGEYRIGREDVLEVVVWHEPELTRVVPVRPDGKISLPLAGEMEAAGRTPAELQAGLSKALGPYIQDAAVAVLVREINNPRIYVLGEVTRPGGFPLRGPMTVVQAIALAGGRTEFAKGDVHWLREKSEGKTDRVELSFDELVKGEAAGALWLRGGDVLYVP
jgi:polysaccharide export outer membrane protein